MERKELTEKVKECIKSSLSDVKAVDELNDDTPLIAEDGETGLFDNSLCVLEVTSGLVTEFEVDLQTSVDLAKHFKGSQITIIHTDNLSSKAVGYF